MHPIEHLCKEYKLTRYSLAKKTTVPQTTLSSIVTRNTPIDNIAIGVIAKIAKGLDTTIDDIYKKLNTTDQ